MPNAKREMLLPPPATYSMQIAGTDTTRLDLNIDIVVAKRLGRELVQVEFRPLGGVFDLKAAEGIWVDHFDFCMEFAKGSMMCTSPREWH